MRLNKEPPDDIPVVEYAGLGDASPSARVTPLPGARGQQGSTGLGFWRRSPTVPSSGGGGDAGAGGGGGAAAVEGDTNDDDDQKADLFKIKHSDSLGEDDNCVVCLSGESRWSCPYRCCCSCPTVVLVVVLVLTVVVVVVVSWGCRLVVVVL